MAHASSPSNTSMNLEYPDSHDLNFSNRLVRARMPGGVAGARLTAAPMPIILAASFLR